MERKQLIENAGRYLQKLCLEIPNRAVGSPGNQAATDYYAGVVASFGFETERQEFECIDWEHGEVKLTVGGEQFEVFAAPYSLGCRVHAPLVSASSLDELEASQAEGKVLLLHGEIAAEQVMPKDYPYYYPEEHQKLHALLEQKAPAAIVTATGKNHSTAGALYPYPMFEDGNFDLPSVYMKDVEGERLALYAGQEAALLSEARRIPSMGCNIVGRKGGGSGRRVLLTSHIDAKIGTPGALDNAGGTVMLMLMAELLRDYDGKLEVESVPFNGEDYYGANGEQLFMERNQGRLEDILLVINMDGLGYIEGRTAYSLYGAPEPVAELIHQTFAEREGFMEGPPWFQGDHSIFIQQGVPAMAITLEHFEYAWEQIAHTEIDTPDLIDPERLVETALRLRELIQALQGVV